MKKLLVLGASNAEVGVVKIAQSMGYFVVVTDYYTDTNIIPAKYIANEAWDISWTDYDTLEGKCRMENIDGIIAGFSEFRVESMIELCRRLNLPCYINREQLEVSRDKNKFKNLCKQFDVPLVKEYEPNSLPNNYPVIIKPTDRGGSIGINVAYNLDEYNKYLEYAYSLSPSKNVIVEDYIEDGVKFDCSYYISDHDIYLIETCDTKMLSKEKGCETLQQAWTFPSKYEQEYLKFVDTKVKKMLASLSMKCGVANISFFYRNGTFYVFETGFRLGGGHSYDYQRASNGIDYLSSMIKYSLNDDFYINEKIPQNRGYAVTYNVFCKVNKNDIIQTIIGEDIVKSLDDTITYIPLCYKGIKVDSNKPIKIAMCTLYSDNLDSILKDLEIVNKSLKIETENNLYQVYSELSPNYISNLFANIY